MNGRKKMLIGSLYGIRNMNIAETNEQINAHFNRNGVASETLA